MRRRACVTGLLLVALGWSVPTRAETPGDKVLRLMDEAMTRAKDQHFEHEITTQEPGKAARVMRMDVTIKGKSWRRVEFLAPGDVQGMRILVLSTSQTYIYLPAFRKIRRVASHVREQGFMGTTYSYDDTSTVTYSPIFEGKLLSETKTHWKVLATKRPGQEYSYSKVEFTIRKDMLQASEIRYFNNKGVHVKTEVRSDYTCKNNICQPQTMQMTDHSRNGAYTKFSCKKWEINTGVNDDFFTVRALQRGR